MQLTNNHCPRCKQAKVKKEARRCSNCFMVLLFPGDDGAQFPGEDYFRWMDGPRGPGWYNKKSCEHIYGQR